MSEVPKPSPPRSPRLRTIFQLTVWEHLFGFQDPTFAAYMRSKSIRSEQLREMGGKLAKGGHPLVRYAAGWAAVELALRPKREQVTLGERRMALQAATELWKDASKGLVGARHALHDRNARQNLNYIEFQLLHALAYLPSLEVAASWLSGNTIVGEELGLKLGETKAQSASFAKFLLQTPAGSNEAVRINRAGLLGEAVCGLVGQADEPMRYLFVPASFRQDRNPSSELRSDFLAISASRRHLKTLIQVKTSTQEAIPCHDKHRLHVDVSRDLILGPRQGMKHTVQAFTT